MVPAAPFEPNTAYSAEVAETIAKRAKPDRVIKSAAVRPKRLEASVAVKASRNLGKSRKVHQRATQGGARSSKVKTTKRGKIEAKNGPFRRI
jgi:hypothetical protein